MIPDGSVLVVEDGKIVAPIQPQRKGWRGFTRVTIYDSIGGL